MYFVKGILAQSDYHHKLHSNNFQFHEWESVCVTVRFIFLSHV